MTIRRCGLVFAALVALVMTSGAFCETLDPTCGDLYVRPVGSGGGSVGDFGPDEEALRLEAFLDAMVNLETQASLLEVQTETACRNLGLDLGMSAAEMVPGDVEATCAAVAARLREDRATLAAASLVLTLDIVPGGCSASLDATVDCYAGCEVDFDVTATPPTCTGGELWVECSGGCSGECRLPSATAECYGSCEGRCEGGCSGSCSGSCSGTCSGICEGTCSAVGADGRCEGTCTGTCRGECDATCEGSCSGTCEGSCSAGCVVEVDEGGCEGECHGGCTGEYTPLRCEGGEFQVEASAECQAACEAEVSLQAECTPPLVFLTVSGDIDGIEELVATYVAALEANLPALLALAEQAGRILDAVVVVAQTAGPGLSAAVSLGLRAVHCATLAATAAVDIQVKLEVSVSASVEVSGEAGATTGG